MYSPQIRKRLRRGLTILTAALILAFCILDRHGSLDWLENRSSDWRVVATLDPAKADHDIVVIDIDNASYATVGKALDQRWPWTRALWDQLVRYIAPGRPRLILFDILFSGPEPGADPSFASAMRTAGNVVLPFAFTAQHADLQSNAKPPDKALLKTSGDLPGPELKKSEWVLNTPTPLLSAAMAGSGTITSLPDRDGIWRRLPLAVRYGGRAWAPLWLAAAMKLNGATSAGFQNGEFHAGPIRLPVDETGAYIVRWRGNPIDAYKRIPLAQIVCSMQPDMCDKGVLRHPASEFRNKIVFIGASAAGSYELRPTAASETAPGFFVLTTALDNLLHNDAVRRAPEIATILLIGLLAALPAWAVAGSRSIAIPLGVTLAALAIYGGACFLFYAHAIWLPMSAPMLAGVVSFGGNTAFRYLTVDRELSRTRGTLERYVSPQLVKYVMDNIDSIRFDGQKRKLTVFFSDVRSFTTLTEKSDPVRLLKQLNEYLEAMTDIIFKYDGIVDKFIGDGIMAHWGAFTPERPNAALAARAALDMMEKLAELNEHWKVNGFPPLDIGIGLNTAEVIFGNVGAGKKLDFTAIGDGVNLAARLESANKEYKTHIIISESTREELGAAAGVAPLGTVVVKGKTVGVTIFELKSLDGSGAPAESV